MIYIDVTLVRHKETKEPVAIFEQENDIVALGRKIDEVSDPSMCQYTDVTIEFDFTLFFEGSFSDFMSCNDEQSKCFESSRFSSETCDELVEYFTDDITDWCDFPDHFDCLCAGLDIEDRFWEEREQPKEGDIF